MDEKAVKNFTVTKSDEEEATAEKSTKTIGKFKNAEELHKAYNALEAEFTRRSQRLAEMERRSKLAADNLGTDEQKVKDEFCNANYAEQDDIAFNAQAGATNLCGDIDCQEKNEQS
ncbi:MAG TPA: hypothetical protein VJZ69_01290, partial [Clostridia bacterium]|nr:hypothetical protein [Clostridia bacterium]